MTHCKSHTRPHAGSLPPSWSELTDLTMLELSYNSLTGTLPPQYSNLNALVQFSASSNGLTGTLPGVWGDGLTSLASFRADYNYLTGAWPTRSRLLSSPNTVPTWRPSRRVRAPHPHAASGHCHRFCLCTAAKPATLHIICIPHVHVL